MRKSVISAVEWSPAQQDHRQRFKAAMADPGMREVYEDWIAKVDRKAFQLAVSEYIKGVDLLSRK